MITADQFHDSYQDVVSYLSTKDPVLANYLVAKLPSSFQIEPQLLLYLKQFPKRQQKKVVTPLSIVPVGEFVNAVDTLATTYTYGTDNIAPNEYRAYKYGRMMKLLGDDRFKKIKENLNEEKKKKKIKFIK